MSAPRPVRDIPAKDVDVVLRAARVFTGVVASSQASTGDLLTLPQLRVLGMVAERPDTTITQVADSLGAHLSSASRLCDRLVASDLIERRTCASDRRQLLLSVTVKGSGLVEEIMEHRRGAFTAILEKMSAADRKALRHCLDVFADAAGESPENSLPFRG